MANYNINPAAVSETEQELVTVTQHLETSLSTLQSAVLRTWGGDAANRPAAQAAFRHRATLNGAARKGAYRPEMEELAAATG